MVGRGDGERARSRPGADSSGSRATCASTPVDVGHLRAREAGRIGERLTSRQLDRRATATRRGGPARRSSARARSRARTCVCEPRPERVAAQQARARPRPPRAGRPATTDEDDEPGALHRLRRPPGALAGLALEADRLERLAHVRRQVGLDDQPAAGGVRQVERAGVQVQLVRRGPRRSRCGRCSGRARGISGRPRSACRGRRSGRGAGGSGR